MPPIQPWTFKPRSYRHFDYPINEKKATALVHDPEKVAKHSFRPFLSMIVSTPRYKKELRKVQPKDRPIRYAAHKDSAIYSYYAYLLTNAYEIFLKDKIYEGSILAYRKLGKSNINFAKEAFQAIDRIAKRDNHCLAIAIDIKSFFDTLDHNILKSAWSEVINQKKLPDDHFAVFKNITNFSWFEKEELEKYILDQTGAAINWEDRQTPILNDREMRLLIKNPMICKKAKDQIDYNTPNRRGIPQGSPISAILANLYMNNFDQKIKEEVQKNKGEYYRYADDILLLIPPEAETEIIEKLEQLMDDSKLKLADDKTEKVIFHFNNQQLKVNNPPPSLCTPYYFKEKLQYLGFEYDGNRIMIRSKSISRFYRKLKTGVHMHQKIYKEKGKLESKMFRRKIYQQYSHLGTRTFYNYVRRADKILGKDYCKAQMKKHWGILHCKLMNID